MSNKTTIVSESYRYAFFFCAQGSALAAMPEGCQNAAPGPVRERVRERLIIEEGCRAVNVIILLLVELITSRSTDVQTPRAAPSRAGPNHFCNVHVRRTLARLDSISLQTGPISHACTWIVIVGLLRSGPTIVSARLSFLRRMTFSARVQPCLRYRTCVTPILPPRRSPLEYGCSITCSRSATALKWTFSDAAAVQLRI